MIFSAWSNWPAAALRIAAAEVTRRQHRLHARVPEHRLRREAHLREQPLGAAAREIEHRLGVARRLHGVADDRDVVAVLDVEQRARRLLRQAARHLLVDEVDDLLAQRRAAAGRGRRAPRLRCAQLAERPVAEALRLVAPVDHQLARQLDRAGVVGVQEEHRRRLRRVRGLVAQAPQHVAHRHRDVAEIDVDRAGRFALVADRAVVGDVAERVPVLQRDAAPGLLLVQEGLDQHRRGEDLVARRIEQVGAGHVRAADRLALAAAQAVLDRVADLRDVRLLHDQRLVAEQVEAGRVGVAQVGARQQLAGVEAAVRVDAVLVARGSPAFPRPSGTRAW